jgi:hypothetical protein
MAPYQDIPANMLGVQLKHTRSSSPPPSPSTPDNLDWAQLSDEALANADIDQMDILSAPPEVIIVDDDDDDHLPHPMKQPLDYFSNIEADITPPFSFSITFTYYSTQPHPPTKPSSISL